MRCFIEFKLIVVPGCTIKRLVSYTAAVENSAAILQRFRTLGGALASSVCTTAPARVLWGESLGGSSEETFRENGRTIFPVFSRQTNSELQLRKAAHAPCPAVPKRTNTHQALSAITLAC